MVGILGLVLNLTDVRALSRVDKVPRCEVEDEGIGIETHGDGEEQEGGATRELHEVRLLPVDSQKHSAFEPISGLDHTGSQSFCNKYDTGGLFIYC